MRMGLKEKLALSTAVFMCVLTFVIAFVGYRLYYDNVMDSYGTYAETVLEYAYRVTVRYSFGDMIADRSMPEDYEEMRRELNAVKDGARIEYLYAIYFDDIDDIHSLHYAINAKKHEELMSGRPLSEIYTYMGRPVEEGGFEDDTLLTLQQAILSRKRESGLLDGYSDEEVGKRLDAYGIAVRTGHHCAQPVLRRFGYESTVRPTIALYNSPDDIDALVKVLKTFA